MTIGRAPHHPAVRTAILGLLAAACLPGCGGGGDALAPDAADVVDAPAPPPDAYQPTIRKAVYYVGIDGSTSEVRELPLGETTSRVIHASGDGDAGTPIMTGNKLFFTVRTQTTGVTRMWVHDPLAPRVEGVNPREAFAINSPGVDDALQQLAAYDGKLYFDATVAGSPHHTFVFDPALPASATNPRQLFEEAALFPVFVAGTMVFRATAAGVGEELLAFDLAAPESATNPVVFDLIPGPQSSQPRDLVVLGGRVYFGADNELHVFDPAAAGSASNPRRVISTGNSGASALAVVGGRLYYQGSTNYSTTGSELMVFDPAAAVSASNPALVEILPGSNGASPDFLQGVGGMLALSAYTPSSGRELYLFDPAAPASPTNPALVDIVPGAADSDPRSLVADGNQLYFTVTVAGTDTYLVTYDSALPTSVTVNPRSVYMTPGETYDLHLGTYVQ